MNLDDAYANGAYIAGAADYPPRWQTQAAAFRAGLGDRARLDLRYGPGIGTGSTCSPRPAPRRVAR